MKKGKNIAVYIPQIYSEYMVGLRKAIEAAARGKGYRLIFFTCFGDNSSMDIEEVTNQRYDEGERSIFRISNLEAADGVILLYDAYARTQYEEIRDMIQNRCPCPVINIRTPLEAEKEDNVYNVFVDDEHAFAEMVQHFIHKHHCQKIDLVTGPEDNVHSQIRMEIYQTVLKENGLPFEMERVHRGNFWKNCGEDIVREILDSSLELPEAIVCANDYMAMSVIDALRDQGILVPDQVLVSGYDDIEESRYNHPALTTVRQPMERIGATAIRQLEKIWNGEKVEKDTYLTEELVCRQSCSCDHDSEDFSLAYSNILNDKMDKMFYLEGAATTMITMMSSATNLDECMEHVIKYALEDTGFKSFALCLADHWEDQLSLPDIDYGSSQSMVTMVAGIHNGEVLASERFPVCQLLPECFAQDTDESIYVIPIHHLECYMGYALVQIDFDVPNSMNIKSWFIHLDNALENIRMKDRLKRVADELERLYVRDTLTGLYNRRGLEKYGKKFYRQCQKEKSYFMVMEVDMDGLKQVNDQHGHEEGDICITMIAKGLIYASKEEEVCIRSGGDEYVVLGKHYSQEKAEHFMELFYEYIENANASMNKPYRFDASIGYYLDIPDEKNSVESYLRIADDRMYTNKKRRKAISHPGVEVR